MANTSQLKSRIRSVEATMKITKAMKLIASAKLSKQRTIMENNREYLVNFGLLMSDVIRGLDDNRNLYITGNTSGKNLYICFSSDLGLCGGYNTNMFRLLSEQLSLDDKVLMIGNKGANFLKRRALNGQFVFRSDGLQLADFNEVVRLVLNDYQKGEYDKVLIIYTNFINTVTFEAVSKQLLPIVVEPSDGQKVLALSEYEPTSEKLLEQMIPMYLSAYLYGISLQSKVSEQASRRFAMENATDNASELKDHYLLQFNQARQAAITQEISEIVGGANAL